MNCLFISLDRKKLKLFISFLKLEIPNIIQCFTFYAFIVFIFKNNELAILSSPILINFLLGLYFWEKAHIFLKEKQLEQYYLESYIGITCIIFTFLGTTFGLMYSILK